MNLLNKSSYHSSSEQVAPRPLLDQQQPFPPNMPTVIFESNYRGADNSLARPGGKQAAATEDFDVHVYHI